MNKYQRTNWSRDREATGCLEVARFQTKKTEKEFYRIRYVKEWSRKCGSVAVRDQTVEEHISRNDSKDFIESSFISFPNRSYLSRVKEASRDRKTCAYGCASRYDPPRLRLFLRRFYVAARRTCKCRLHLFYVRFCASPFWNPRCLRRGSPNIIHEFRFRISVDRWAVYTVNLYAGFCGQRMEMSRQLLYRGAGYCNFKFRFSWSQLTLILRLGREKYQCV